MDVEEQENELLALESIYEDRQFLRSKEEAGGEISIFLDVSQPFTVTFTSSVGCHQEAVVQQEHQEKCEAKKNDVLESNAKLQVNHLPPVVLNFTFPHDYPSSKPPTFTLSCKWMNDAQLARLCEQLDLIWKNVGPGMVIMFEWVQFLTDETESFLGIESPFVIDDINLNSRRRKSIVDSNVVVFSSSKDSRAIQDVASLETLKDCLIEYDNCEQKRQFDTTLFTCNVCFMERRGEICCSFHPCKHIYCNECMTVYFSVQIRDGAVKALICPENKCDSQAIPSQVKKLVSRETYEKYEKFLLQSSLDCMSDILYCPRKVCQSPVLLETDSSLGMCPDCSFAFCTLCRRSYHGLAHCAMNESEYTAIRKIYVNAGPEERIALEKRYGRMNVAGLYETKMSEGWIASNTKRCPQCKAMIEKSSGCNKMNCYRCLENFCWVCLKVISKSTPYRHFAIPSNKCFNKLF